MPKLFLGDFVQQITCDSTHGLSCNEFCVSGDKCTMYTQCTVWVT